MSIMTPILVGPEGLEPPTNGLTETSGTFVMLTMALTAKELTFRNFVSPTFFRKRRTTSDSKLLTIWICMVKLQLFSGFTFYTFPTQLLNRFSSSFMVAI